MLVGTLASPELLSSPHARRASLVAEIVEQGIDHVFVADHVSFHVGAGMKSLYRVPFERFEKYSPYGTAAAVAEIRRLLE